MTPINLEALQPVLNPDRLRFEISLGDDLAVLEYKLEGDTMVMFHTGVPRAYQGQGVAAALTKFALDWAAAEGYKVDPRCSFVERYVQRHPEYQANTLGF